MKVAGIFFEGLQSFLNFLILPDSYSSCLNYLSILLAIATWLTKNCALLKLIKEALAAQKAAAATMLSKKKVFADVFLK